MDLEKYVFYAGTDRGFILNTTINPTKIKAAKPEEPSEVTALTFGKTDEELYIGYENGKVDYYNISEDKYLRSLDNLVGEGKIVGLKSVGKNVIAARHDGIINVWCERRNNYFDIGLDQKGTLDCMAYNDYRQNVVGSGGEHNDFRLWDIETHQNIFKAKSLGHDMLNLPIPTSVRGITFFPTDPFLGACCSKQGHVLLYDERAQRRPVTKFLQANASYSTIACAYRERQCLVGTTRGYLQLIDMKTGKCLKTFTTFTGSITCIVCDPVEPYITTASLDKFLRVHNIETKELIHKMYMKQNLTKLLVKSLVKEEPIKENETIVDQEYEDIFDNMQTIEEVENKTKKRKSKTDNLVRKKILTHQKDDLNIF